MIKHARQRPQRSFYRTLRSLVLGAASLIALAVVAVIVLASLDLTLSLRRALADDVLTSILGRQVEVRGNVELTLGTRVHVGIEDAYIDRSPDGQSGKSRVFEKISFASGYGLFLGDLSGITNYRMSGAEIEYRPESTDAGASGTSLFELPSTIINSPVLDNLELSDVTFRLVDPADGWNETFEIDSLKMTSARGAGTTDVVFDASINGTRLSAEGTLPSAAEAREKGGGVIDLSFKLPGLASRLAGNIDTTEEIASLNASLSSETGSITEALSSMGFTTSQDGQATLDWKLSGPVDQLDIHDLSIVVKDVNGDQLTLAGSVSDSTKEAVFDLDFAAELMPVKPASSNPFAINVESFSGTISGPVSALTIADAKITTDAALLDFDEIGPISAGRVVKHPDNTIGLRNVIVKDGPEDAPYLTMTGHVEDLMALAGFDLSGSYRFPASLLLDRTSDPVPELGFIEGDVSLNEASGALGLDTLTGKAVETDLYDLTFELVIPELRMLDELTFSTSVALPDPSAFLKALDITPDRTLPALSFNGSSGFSPEGAKLNGRMTTGATAIDADLELGPEDDGRFWMLSGSISSAQMELSDLAGLEDFAQLELAQPQDDIVLPDKFTSRLRAEIALHVRKFISGRKSAGNLSGTLRYEADKVHLSKLNFDYIGGTVSGDFSIDLATAVRTGTAHGRMEKFPLGNLMSELGFQSPISSTVNASFDVSGSTVSQTALLKSLSGNLTASLWGGTLPNRLIDLTGLNVLTWLVTSNRETGTKLVCALIPLRLKDGAATTNSLIVETENVQIIGTGSINFNSGALDLSFMPRAKRKQLVEIVSPFELHGTISDPKLVLRNAGAGRALGEIVSLPLNLLGYIFTGARAVDEHERPCVLPRNTKPK